MISRLPSIQRELDTCEIKDPQIPRLSRLSKEANQPRALHASNTIDFVEHSGAYSTYDLHQLFPEITEPSSKLREELQARSNDCQVEVHLKRSRYRTIGASELLILQPLRPHYLSVGRCRRLPALYRAYVQWVHRYGSKLGQWLGR